MEPCNREIAGSTRGRGSRNGNVREHAARIEDGVRAPKTITVKPFGPILTQPAIAIMDRRAGITRCRVYYARARV